MACSIRIDQVGWNHSPPDSEMGRFEMHVSSLLPIEESTKKLKIGEGNGEKQRERRNFFPLEIHKRKMKLGILVF